MTEVAGFLSYVRSDDEHEGGRISDLRKLLQGEVQMQTGTDFRIFQDKEEIFVGQQWRDRIQNSIDGSTILVVVITPSLLKSQMCREEIELFLRREQLLGRDDLIVPLLYMDTPALFEEIEDPLIQQLVGRQYFDLRETRFDPVDSPEVRRAISELAEQVSAALVRSAANPQTISPEEVGEGRLVEDEGPGFLELSAAAEEAMPAITVIIESLAAQTNNIGQAFSEASVEMNAAETRGQSAAGRLIAVKRLSARLEDPAAEIEGLAAQYADEVARLDPAMEMMAGQVAEVETGEDLDAARGLADAVAKLDAASSESFASLGGLMKGLKKNEGLSSSLRPVLRRIREALARTAESAPVFHNWSRDLEHAVATADARMSSLDTPG